MPYQIRLADLARERSAQAELLRGLEVAALEATDEDSKTRLAGLIKAAAISLSDTDTLIASFTALQKQANIA
jgi:hypothetical protein